MKIQTIFKKSVVFSTVMLLCLLMALMSVPVMADEVTDAARVYNISYDANGNRTETFVQGYDTVAKAFKAATEDQLIRLYQDANLTLNPHQTYKVDKNGHLLSVASNAGFGAKIVENRDGTVTVSTYKNQGEWYKKMDVAVAGTFGMRFYFSSLGTIAENNNAYLEVKVPNRDKTYNVTKLYKKDFKVDEEGLYYFVVEVAQAQLTDSISFQIVNGTEKGRLRQYAFRDYADKLFAEADKAGAAETVKEAVQPVKKMLNLGAQAQALFNYNTKDLANEGIYDKGSNPVNSDTLASTKKILANVGEAKKVATTKINTAEYSLYLQSQTALQFRFVVTGLAEGEIPTAAISYGGNATQKAGVAQGKLNDKETDCWYVSISNIPVRLYDTVFTVTFKCGGETATYSASVLQWLNAALEKGTPNQKNTATALYQYYLEMKGDDAVAKPQECQHTNTHVEILKAATCTEAGISQTVCSDCGNKGDTNEIKALGHNEKTYARVEATCTSNGWKSYTVCTVCGHEVTAKEVLKATGHSYTSGYTFNGKDVIKTGTCDACGETVTEIVSLTDIVTSVTVNGNKLTELGQTDTYDWKSQAANTITFTYDSENIAGIGTGKFAYKVGDTFVEFEGTSFAVPELTDTVTLVIGYEIAEGVYVPVATIYNVGTPAPCSHEGTLSTEWIKGKGYADVCSKCGYVGDAKPFKWTKNDDSMYESTKDNGFTVTNNDGYVSYVVNETTNLGASYSAPESERNAYLVNNNVSADRVGRYMIIKYRANTAYKGDIQVYATTLNTGITTNYDILDKETGKNLYKATNDTTTATEYVVLDENGNAPEGYTLVLDNGNLISKKSGTIQFSTSINLVKEATLTEDSEWQIIVLDLDARIKPYTVDDGYNEPYVVDPFEEKDGKYAIKTLRLDYVNNAYGSTAGAQLDIAYVGFSNDTNEIKSIVIADKNANCNHSAVDTDANGKALWYSAPGNAEHWNICMACGENVKYTAHTSVEVVSKGDGKNHTAKCTDCGVEFSASCTDVELMYNDVSKKYDGCCECGAVVNAGRSYFLVFDDSGKYMANTNATVTKNQVDGDGTTYSRVTESLTSSDDSFYMYVGGTEKSGQYMVIKYRVPTYYGRSEFGATYIGTTNSGLTGANGSKGDTCDGVGKVNKTGSWQIAVIDLSTTKAATCATQTITNKDGSTYIRSPKFIKDEDGCYYTSYVRMTLANLHSKTTCSCTDTNDDGVIDHDASKTMYMDVAFVAFADNLGAIANYISNEEIKIGEGEAVINPCQHDFKDKGDIAYTDEGHATTCAACGQITGTLEAHDAVTAPGVYNSVTKKYETVCQCGYVIATDVNFVLDGQVLADNLDVIPGHTNGHIESVNVNGDGNVVVDFVEGESAIMYLFGGKKLATPTGRYLVMKYKVNSGSLTGLGTLYAAGGNVTNAEVADWVTLSNGWVGDGEWKLFVVDLGLCPRVEADAENGTFINFVRLDMENVAGKKIQLEIDYAAMAEDLDQLKAYVTDSVEHTHYYNGEYTYKDLSAHNSKCFYCGVDMPYSHKSDNNSEWNEITKSYTTNCTVCGGYATSQPFLATVNINNSGNYGSFANATDRFALDTSAGTVKISGVLDTTNWSSEDKTSWQKVDGEGTPIWTFYVLNTDPETNGTGKYMHKTSGATDNAADAKTVELASPKEGSKPAAIDGYEYKGIVYRGVAEMWGTLLSSGKVTGRYMIVKYRASTSANAKTIEIFTNTQKNSTAISTYAGGTKNISFSFSMVGDNNWHIYVVDLANRLQQDANKTYDDPFVAGNPIMYFRMDYVNDWKMLKGDYIEYAYIGISNSLTEVSAAIAKMGDDVYCPHSIASADSSVSAELSSDDNTHWNVCLACGAKRNEAKHVEEYTPNGDGKHTATCETCNHTHIVTCTDTVLQYNSDTRMYDGYCVCGQRVTANKSHLILTAEPRKVKYDTGVNNAGISPEEMEENGVNFVRYTSLSKGDDHYNFADGIYMNSDANKVTGQYAVIKYRFPEGGSTSTAFSVYAATVNSGKTYADHENEKVGVSSAIAVDGKWHIAIVDLSKAVNYKIDDNGNYVASFVRLGWNSVDRTPEDTTDNAFAVLDLDYIAFADDIGAVAKFVATEEKASCLHTEFEGYEHSTAEFIEGVGYAQTCGICGNLCNIRPFATTILPSAIKNSVGQGSDYGKWNAVVQDITEDGTVKFSSETGTANADGKAGGMHKTLKIGNDAYGPYVIVKMRANKNYEMEIFTNTLINSAIYSHPVTKADGTPGTKSYAINAKLGTYTGYNAETGESEWQIFIINLDKQITLVCDDGADAYDPEKPLKFFRFDLLDSGLNAGQWAEFAYVGIADDPAEIASALGTDRQYCTHSASAVDTSKWIATEDGTKCGNLCACGTLVNLKDHVGNGVLVEGTTPDATTHTETCVNCNTEFAAKHTAGTKYFYDEATQMYYHKCTVCEANMAETASYFLKQVSITTGKTNQDDGDGVKYTRITRTGTTEGYFFLINDNTDETGNYMIIKYRAPEGAFGSSNPRTTGNNYATTTNHGNNPGGASYYAGGFGPFYADGTDDWNILVVKIAEKSGNMTADENGDWAIKYIRATFWDKGVEYKLADGSAAYLDIAFVAFADELDAIAKYVQREENNNTCYHNNFKGEYFWEDEEKAYVKRCVVCNDVLDSKVLLTFFDAETIASKATLSGVTEELIDGGGVRFTSTSDTNGTHGRCYPITTNNPTQTGQYLIIKYRSNYGRSPSVYATTEGTDTNGDAPVNGVTLKGETNGETKWHILVVDMTEKGVAKYLVPVVNNGVEQYFLKNLTIDLMDREDSRMPVGAYIEYDYIALTGDLRSINTYFEQTGDAAYCDHVDGYVGDSTVCRWCGYDKAAAQLVVTTDAQTYTADQEITASVTVKNNPGFNAIPIALTYTDSEGTVKVVEEYTVESCATGFTEGDTMLVEKEDTTDYTADGELVTLTFAAPADAGTYKIGVIVTAGEQIINESENQVDFVMYDATITVIAAVAE